MDAGDQIIPGDSFENRPKAALAVQAVSPHRH